MGSERDRLIAGVTVDFEDEVTSSLGFFTCGVGSLGFDYDPALTLGDDGPSSEMAAVRNLMRVEFSEKKDRPSPDVEQTI